MTTIAEVRDNLSAICDTLDGWHGSAYVGDSATAGVIKVFRQPYDPRYVFGSAKAALMFQLVAYAKRIESRTSEAALDELCEPTGLIAAVALSTNWSVTIDSAQVVQVGEIAVAAIEGVEYLVCPFDVEVVL